jgi:hypothetical protein
MYIVFTHSVESIGSFKIPLQLLIFPSCTRPRQPVRCFPTQRVNEWIFALCRMLLAAVDASAPNATVATVKKSFHTEIFVNKKKIESTFFFPSSVSVLFWPHYKLRASDRRPILSWDLLDLIFFALARSSSSLQLAQPQPTLSLSLNLQLSGSPVLG